MKMKMKMKDGIHRRMHEVLLLCEGGNLLLEKLFEDHLARGNPM
jgi:hypothetical protein